MLTVLKKWTENDLHVESKREGQIRRLVEAAYSTYILSASPGDQHMKGHSDKPRHKKAYYDVTEESSSKSSPSNKKIAGSSSRRYIPTPERNWNVVGLKVTKLVDEHFPTTFDIRNHSLLKKASRLTKILHRSGPR